MIPNPPQLRDPQEFAPQNKWSVKSFIININLVLILFGYQIYTSILSAIIPADNIESTWIFTIPIRLISLFVSICAIFLGSTKNKKWSVLQWAFVFFYILYTFRFFIDLFSYHPGDDKYSIATRYMSMHPSAFIQQSLGYYALAVFGLISIYKTWKQIDYDKTLNLALILGNIAILAAIYGMSKNYIALIGVEAEERYNATSMLNTISLGHFAISITILSVFKFFKTPSLFFKIVNIFFAIIVLLMALRAGSRGPIAAFIFVVVFWIASYYRNILLGLGIFSVLSVIIFALRWTMLDLIQKISPILYYRFEATLKWGDSSDRDFVIGSYIDAVKKHPFFGVQTDIFGYAHNMVVDSFVMLGVTAGWILPAIFIACICATYKLLVNKNNFHWICLIFLQLFIAGMFSGCFSMATGFQILLFLIILIRNEQKRSQPALLESPA